MLQKSEAKEKTKETKRHKNTKNKIKIQRICQDMVNNMDDKEELSKIKLLKSTAQRGSRKEKIIHKMAVLH